LLMEKFKLLLFQTNCWKNVKC